MKPATKLARAFCRILLEWLGPQRLGKVAARNRREKHPEICHSHDFCDANQAMLDAFRRALRRKCRAYDHSFSPRKNGADASLLYQAWHIAKRAGFRIENICPACGGTGQDTAHLHDNGDPAQCETCEGNGHITPKP